MRQSRRMSLAESALSTLIGFGVAFCVQVLVLPLFGVYLPPADHTAIAAIFTAVSVVRGYFVRRLFNLWSL
jgi:hypothetical protein